MNNGVRHGKNIRRKAWALRQAGKSINDIARTLGVSKCSASLWCRTVLLAPEQLRQLRKNSAASQSKARELGWATLRQQKRDRMAAWLVEADRLFERYRSEPLFMLGIGLYWGEGSKSHRHLEMTNVDHRVHVAWKAWFERYIPTLSLSASFRTYVGNDVEHAKRFWRRHLGVNATVTTSWPKKEHNRTKWPNGVMRLTGKGVGVVEWHFKLMRWIDLASVVQQPERLSYTEDAEGASPSGCTTH